MYPRTYASLVLLLCAAVAHGQTSFNSTTAGKIRTVAADPTGNACLAGDVRSFGGSIYACSAGNVYAVVSAPALTYAGSAACQAGISPDTIASPQCIAEYVAAWSAGGLSSSGPNAGQVKLYEAAANGEEYIAVTAPDALAATYELKLPLVAPSAGQVLVFGAPSSGISTATWGTSTAVGANVMHVIPLPFGARSAGGTLRPSGIWFGISGGANAEDSTDPTGSLGKSVFLEATATASNYITALFQLPEDWYAAANHTLKLAAYTGSGTETHLFRVGLGCRNGGSAVIGKPTMAYTAYQNVAANNTTSTESTLTLPAIPAECVPGAQVWLDLQRDSTADTGTANANVYRVRVVTGRTITAAP